MKTENEIKVSFSEGLTNSQSYITIESAIKEIRFDERFVDCINVKDCTFSDVDLQNLLKDITTHYRNQRAMIHNENYWRKFKQK